MSTNTSAALQTTLDDLSRQHRAAVRRQQDLEQQLKAAQESMGKLGFMQLGKKMLLKAEIDSINSKLTANRQLQESLSGRMTAARAQLETALAEASAAAEEAAPVIDAPAPVAEEPAAAAPVPVIDVPVIAAEEPAPAAEAPTLPAAEEAPAAAAAPVPVIAAEAPAPRKPRAAAPRKSVPRAPRLEIDAALSPEEQLTRLLAHLEGFYPEHQFFSPEVLTAETRALLASLAGGRGCSLADLLATHGWQVITPAQGRAMRAAGTPAPGCEPAALQPKLTAVLARLDRHYTDHIIGRSIQHDHKALAQDVSALSAHLGYPTPGAMLTAYGYRYEVRSSGRPALDMTGVVDTLRAAYDGKEKPRSIAQIAADHPEYAAVLKTLQNQAPKRFGMSLKQYFVQQGIM